MRFLICSHVLSILSNAGSVAGGPFKPTQIVINGAPPPPPAASATASVAGSGWSFAIPGITASTWTPANSAALCSALVNITVGK
jgi:hypothetical protein